MSGVLGIRGYNLRSGWIGQAEALRGRPGFLEGAKTACDALPDSASVWHTSILRGQYIYT